MRQLRHYEESIHENPPRFYIHVRTQPAFTCSKSTMETPEQCVKPVPG